MKHLVLVFALTAGFLTAADAQAQSKSFKYARLGYGAVFGDGTTGTPAIGFGYRAALTKVALDISFLNFQVSQDAGAWSLLRLGVLRVVRPEADGSMYFGGGLGFGGSGRGNESGFGLQGALTTGYEAMRTTRVRVMIQGDVTLPMYKTKGENYSYNPNTRTGTSTTTSSYTPSVALSFGLGW